MFPEIRHLDQVRPFIKDRHEFSLFERDNHIIVDYIYNFGDTFEYEDGEKKGELNPVLCECRGIIFDLEGNLVSRPLAKFMNLGERFKEHQNLDWANATVATKEDGSMIRPLWLNGSWRLATRKGITHVAMQAEEFVEGSKNKVDYITLFEHCREIGATPVFEWCSRQNRIVIDHPEEKLILLAIRDNVCGDYYSHQYLEDLLHCLALRIPLVGCQNFSSAISSSDFIQSIRDLKEGEGVVVTFPDGMKVKIKSDMYVQLHRTKSLFDSEKNIVEAFLVGNIDDLYPLLTVPQKCRLDKYLNDFRNGLGDTVQELAYLLGMDGDKYLQGDSKRDYACEFVLKQDPKWKNVLFSLWEKKDCYASLEEMLIPFIKYNDQKALDASRWIFKAEWC